VQLFPVEAGIRGEARSVIPVPPDGLACSFQHEIIIE